jgi:hypothetical protein
MKLELKKEGYKSNASGGGVGPRNKGPRSHPSAGLEEEGEDASSLRIIEEVWRNCPNYSNLSA